MDLLYIDGDHQRGKEMVPSRNLGIQPGRVAYHLPSCHCMPGRPCVFGSSLPGDARPHLLIAYRQMWCTTPCSLINCGRWLMQKKMLVTSICTSIKCLENDVVASWTTTGGGTSAPSANWRNLSFLDLHFQLERCDFQRATLDWEILTALGNPRHVCPATEPSGYLISPWPCRRSASHRPS